MCLIFLKHSTVLLSKQAIVIGPTPPGTGVIAFATFETSSKSTSPTKPLSVLFIPTSITIASFFTQSPLTNSGLPTAAIIISALLHSAFKSFVFECVIVTVQFSFKSNYAIGFPFKFDLPITTACLPFKFFSTFLSNK